jgi:hypothetical protein
MRQGWGKPGRIESVRVGRGHPRPGARSRLLGDLGRYAVGNARCLRIAAVHRIVSARPNPSADVLSRHSWRSVRRRERQKTPEKRLMYPS